MLGAGDPLRLAPDDEPQAGSPRTHLDTGLIGRDAKQWLPLTVAKFTISAIWFVYRLVATLLLAGGALGQIILIITRNLFGAQPASSTVAATLALTMGGVLYIGVCPSHISFRVANDGLRRLIPGFGALCALIAAAISGALAYYGVRAVIDQHALGASVQSFNFPVWVAFLVLPLSATALCVRFVTQAWRELDPLKKEKHS